MVVVIASGVVTVIKTEQIRDFLVRRMITKQLVFIDKGKI